MSPLSLPEGIERYVEEHTTAAPDHLAHLAEETATMPGAGMLSGPVEGRLLQTLAFLTGARLALDIGTFTGNSALWLASGMGPDGKVVTCDRDEEVLGVAGRHIGASPHGDRIEIRVGPALDTIASLDGPFDVVFIDADKASYVDYFEAVVPKLADRGVIAADNTLWSGRVIDTSDRSDDTEGIRRFNDHVANDRRVVATMLTVRDGITLIRRA